MADTGKMTAVEYDLKMTLDDADDDLLDEGGTFFCKSATKRSATHSLHGVESLRS